MAKAERIIDLGADFRLQDKEAWAAWYGMRARGPTLRIPEFVYGVPEIYEDQDPERADMSPGRAAKRSSPSSASIRWSRRVSSSPRPLSSTPRWEAPRPGMRPRNPPTIRSGRASSAPTSRRGTATRPRSTKPSTMARGSISVHISATAIEMVRGILVTIHAFCQDPGLAEKDVWKAYRAAYQRQAFRPDRQTDPGTLQIPGAQDSPGDQYLRDRL